MLFFLFHFHIIWLLRGSIEANAVQSSYEDCILVARHVCVPITMWPEHLVCLNQWKNNVDSIFPWEFIHTRRCLLLSLLSILIKCDRMNKWVCFRYRKRSKTVCFSRSYISNWAWRETDLIHLNIILRLSLLKIDVRHKKLVGIFNKEDMCH
jgi:hypothetical protein